MPGSIRGAPPRQLLGRSRAFAPRPAMRRPGRGPVAPASPSTRRTGPRSVPRAGRRSRRARRRGGAHSLDQDRVLREVAALGVDDARSGRDGVGDDAVPGLGHHHVHRPDDVGVGEPERLQPIVHVGGAEPAELRRAPCRAPPSRATPRRRTRAAPPACRRGRAAAAPRRAGPGVAGPPARSVHVREHGEVAGEGELEEQRGVPVGPGGQLGRGCERGLADRQVAVDPVPGEVAEPDRRDAGPVRGLEGERGDVGHHQPDPGFPQEGRLGVGPRFPGRVEGGAGGGGPASSMWSASGCTSPTSQATLRKSRSPGMALRTSRSGTLPTTASGTAGASRRTSASTSQARVMWP